MKTRKPAVISVIGSKNSGKTTVIEILTRELTRRGYRVAAVKHISERDFTIDTEGKDTWRFAKAGAKTVVAISPTEIATIEKVDTSKLTLKNIVEKCVGSDIAIIEGFRKLIGENVKIPKIITVKTAEEALGALKTFKPIIAFTGLAQIDHAKVEIPYMNVLEDGSKLAELVEDFMRKRGKFRLKGPLNRDAHQTFAGFGDSVGGERRARKNRRKGFSKSFHRWGAPF
ncbi:MAG: molybdopterin-guanine dinucleotide biosynthesis protein B [Candidatus Bathyarchaeota archaeon]|nr:molybdopterin-guanine dinucleotide biosynthesis protein B [Candidatus Bathyarchaeota archaeon]MDW8041053.1 molybdopterin-guanine dinucleotide biosynthesis protein B [Nitrososphaerota archaeon]